MQNPFQQAAQTTNNNLNDPLAFVKKLWGDMQLPGMVTPTLSVDELDKQIKDLKTVESWLNVNMNMLKGTIQALEVQRATISALKTMGESFAQAGNAASQAADTNHAGWPMRGNTQAATSNVVPEPSVEENEEDGEEDGAPEEERMSAQSAQPTSATSTSNATPSDSAPFHNPAAWWTVLQDQFKQALSHAMKDEGADATADQPTPAQTKRTAKTSSAAQSATTTKSGSKISKKVAEKTPAVKEKLPAKHIQKVAAKAATKKSTKSPVKSRAT
ncbi:MAG: PhaM family polyhydroxyalkanoate granule multifunctional regulatory protein [Candidatus Aquirickettsiella gammari]